MLDGDQGVVEFDEVLLAVLLHSEVVELKAHPVVGLGPQLPLQVGAGLVLGVWEPRGPQLALLLDVERDGLPN